MDLKSILLGFVIAGIICWPGREVFAQSAGTQSTGSPDTAGQEVTNICPPGCQLKSTARQSFSQTEVEILQSLSISRAELEGKKRQLKMRRDLLRATEAKLDAKLESVSSLKEEIQSKLVDSQ